MGYQFNAQDLGWLNRFTTHVLQLQYFRGGLWNGDYLTPLVQNHGVTPIFQDLNGFLEEVEADGFDSTQFHELAPSCRSMCLEGGPPFQQVLAALYGQDQLHVGSFIVRCMRVYNRHKHDKATLEGFAALFAALNITITGPWNDCLLAKSFGSATFIGNHTVEVEK